jgi:hypothetical protein
MFLARQERPQLSPDASPALLKLGGGRRLGGRCRSVRTLQPLITGILLWAFSLGWFGGSYSYWRFHSHPRRVDRGGLAYRRCGRANHRCRIWRRSKRQEQTLKRHGTWSVSRRNLAGHDPRYRPDLAEGRTQAEILELPRGPKIAREIIARFTERNAGMLRKRGLPVTPGTLYLAHFAGGAGAVAILSAMENADAALVMATADATGRTKREKSSKQILSSKASL